MVYEKYIPTPSREDHFVAIAVRIAALQDLGVDPRVVHDYTYPNRTCRYRCRGQFVSGENAVGILSEQIRELQEARQFSHLDLVAVTRANKITAVPD